MLNPKIVTIITLREPEIQNFSLVRNELLQKVVTPWVLFLDADEVLSDELEKEITKVVNTDKYDAYFISRIDKFMGRILKHGETGHVSFIRLGKKNYGKWVRPVHELWEGRGNPAAHAARIGKLKYPILHNPHSSISTFLGKINHYSDLESAYRFKLGRRSSLLRIFVYPLAKFKLNYIFRLGFLDGLPGLIHATMMSYHSYLTWSKLYMLCKKH